MNYKLYSSRLSAKTEGVSDAIRVGFQTESGDGLMPRIGIALLQKHVANDDNALAGGRSPGMDRSYAVPSFLP